MAAPVTMEGSISFACSAISTAGVGACVSVRVPMPACACVVSMCCSIHTVLLARCADVQVQAQKPAVQVKSRTEHHACTCC